MGNLGPEEKLDETIVFNPFILLEQMPCSWQNVGQIPFVAPAVLLYFQKPKGLNGQPA